MTRVLYLTLNNNCGSTNAPLAAWIETFQRRGVGVSIVCREGGGPLYDFAGKWRLPIYSDPMPTPSKSRPWPFLRSLYAMSRIARRHKIDLIHCNEHALYPIARLLGRVTRRPVVVSVHFQIEEAYADWAMAGARQPARMIFVSQAVLEQSRPALAGRVDESRWCVVRNGMDLTKHVPDRALGQKFRAEHNIGASDPVIGVSCLLQPRKQVDHLALVAERLAAPNLRVLIAGGPAKEHEPYVKAMLDDARRRLGPRLIVLGHMTDLRGFYNALDLFVNTSLQEACSISVLEAMACARPVIGYPSMSVDEQVGDDAGEITRQNNIDALAAALTQWLGDPERRAEAGVAARRRVEQHYDVNALAEVVCREYQTAIDGGWRMADGGWKAGDGSVPQLPSAINHPPSALTPSTIRHPPSAIPPPAACSIIMPCYNRASFLPEAVGAIKAQTFTDWELIVVDDGSTDDTAAVLKTLTAGLSQSVRYIHQQNAGAYAARNAGLDLARGRFIAFYDSDDLWLPHHLTDGVAALNDHRELDWVYGDSTKINQATGKVVVPRGFYEFGGPHPMLGLRNRQFGKLHIYDDPRTAAVQIRHNLCCLLQASVIRSKVFDGRRFVADDRNEGEDEVFPIRAIKAGFCLGYLDDIHLTYRVHGDNASAAAVGGSVEKRLRIISAALRGYEALGQQVGLTRGECRALSKRIAHDCFWKRGYVLYWANNRRAEALADFRQALRHDPWNLPMWKTYLLSRWRAGRGFHP